MQQNVCAGDYLSACTCARACVCAHVYVVMVVEGGVFNPGDLQRRNSRSDRGKHAHARPGQMAKAFYAARAVFLCRVNQCQCNICGLYGRLSRSRWNLGGVREIEEKQRCAMRECKGKGIPGFGREDDGQKSSKAQLTNEVRFAARKG